MQSFLVKSASFILLQGVPSTVSLERVRLAIRRVPGVLSIHELHVWQLSESRLIASVHVCVSSKSDYMEVQSRIRRVLHDQGMHSSTIQPEVYHPETAVPEEDLVVLLITSTAS
jgi:zinc transporter 1